MKHWIVILALLSFACNNSSRIKNTPPKDSPVYFPYAPVLSNNFEKGDDHEAKKVLDIWRLYETGSLVSTVTFFTDSIRFILPDKILEGKREAVVEEYQKRRETFSNVQCFVYSWMPVHTTDTKENLVFVWGLYDGTKKNGDRDYAQVHEIWRFDKWGRIKEMEQFRTHPH